MLGKLSLAMMAAFLSKSLLLVVFFCRPVVILNLKMLVDYFDSLSIGLFGFSRSSESSHRLQKIIRPPAVVSLKMRGYRSYCRAQKDKAPAKRTSIQQRRLVGGFL